MIRPARGVAECAPDRDADRLRREADHRDGLVERSGDGMRQLFCIRVGGHSAQRRVDVVERAVGLEEEVPPETATSDSRPSATSTSTATSFPPGTLYSPRIRPAYPAGFSAVSAVEDHTPPRAVRICSEGRATK